MTPEGEHLWFLSEQAKKINRLASKPVIRARLRDYISRGFPRDPRQMLTYKSPGTLTAGETENPIWMTHYHAPEHATLSPLGSEEEERQRQAVMLVAIHDASCQVKISDGHWSPELLECLVGQVKESPPDGPSEDAILEALNWLEFQIATEVRVQAVPSEPTGPGQREVEAKPAGSGNVMDKATYQMFLRETRDTIAVWIDEQWLCDLFAADMQEAQRQWREYRDIWQRRVDWDKAFRDTPEGRAWYEECARRREEGRDDYPMQPQEPPETLPDNPLDKFRWPIKPGALTSNDYRFLLGVVHDGVTWHDRDKGRLICPALRKTGTFVDLLFWKHLWHGLRYQPLIEEALREVRRDIVERKGRAERTETQSGQFPRETLASIIPHLAGLDSQPEQVWMDAVGQAHAAARYALENEFSFDDKEQVKRLFEFEYDRALISMRNVLNSLDLTRDARDHRQRQFEDLYEQARQLLHDSLDAGTLDHAKFNELERRLLRVKGGLSTNAGTWIKGESHPEGHGWRVQSTQAGSTHTNKLGTAAGLAKLLGLLREVDGLWDKDPKRNPDLWEQCRADAAAELKDQMAQEWRRREVEAAIASAARTGPPASGQPHKEDDPSTPSELEIDAEARKKYAAADPAYVKAFEEAVQTSQARFGELARDIHLTLYPIQGELRSVDVAQGTLRVDDWMKIRRDMVWPDVVRFKADGQFRRAIDALEVMLAAESYNRATVTAAAAQFPQQDTPPVHEDAPAGGNEPLQLPVTLIGFMQQYCQGEYSKSLLQSKKNCLLAASRSPKNSLKLPKSVGKWKRGQRKRFRPDDLIAKWPEFLEEVTDLPPLKSEYTHKSA